MDSPTYRSAANNVYGTLLTITAWFAIILQWVIMEGSIVNFFSYFTILSNILIAISLTISFLNPSSLSGFIFSRPSVQTALALYIAIVALVYNLVLRNIWSPTGWQLVADNLLHVVVPVMYLGYWAFFLPGQNLRYKDSLHWVYFPLLYLVYSLIRGSLIHWYPYPFLNVDQLGYEQTFLNVALMIMVFLIMGCVLIALGKLKKR